MYRVEIISNLSLELDLYEHLNNIEDDLDDIYIILRYIMFVIKGERAKSKLMRFGKRKILFL